MTRKRVEAVGRALRVLMCFGEGREALSLHQIAEHTGLYKSTVLRMCASLEEFHVISRGADGLFRPGPALWRLGSLYSRSFRLAEHVYPVLKDLVDRTGECATFYVRHGSRRVCLYRRLSPQRIRYHVEEGETLPLEHGAGGKILLAFSGAGGDTHETIRRKGHYCSFGEVDSNLAAVSAPVFGMEDVLLGALAVSGLRSRFTPTFVRRATRIVTAAATGLGKRLGASGSYQGAPPSRRKVA